MSEPNLPGGSQEQSLTNLLQSIALEEVSLAHIENAEGQKIEEIVNDFGDLTVEEVLELQDSVDDTLKTTIKKQMLLQFKLEDVLEFLEPIGPIISNTGTVTAEFNGTTVSDEDVAFYNEEVNNS